MTHTETEHVGPPNLQRRKFLQALGAFGAGVTALAAEAFGSTSAVQAAPGCCGLYFPPGNSNYDCGSCGPPPYHWTSWFCYESSQGRYRACGECTGGTTCWYGPFKKSCWWWA
jgi:hypothetical protein